MRRNALMGTVPIRLRVAGAFAVAMAVVLAATSWFLYVRLGDDLSSALDRDLRLRAQDLTALVHDPRSSLAAAGSGLVESGESYAQLVDERGRVLEATRQLGKSSLISAAELARARRETFTAARESVPGLDEPSRLLATPVERGGHRLVLVVGATSQDRTETLASFRDELLVAGPIALLLATLAGYALAGVALRPVETMRRRAAEISAETAGERLPVPQTHDELERLGETLNEMLGRLEDALQRERAFVADAGHELRTPLALLRTEIEVALRQAESPDELRDALRRSAEEADRLSQLAESLLLVARSEQGQLALQLETLDVDELFATTVSRFEWRTAEQLIEPEPASLRVEGDRLRLEQALGNLVDNALRYGEAPVRLWAERINGRVELHVRDGGPGFPPAYLEHAFERFTRPDGGRRGGGGAGLGLSIVESIAVAHGGDAHAVNRPEGGADVWFWLPALP